MKGLKIFLSALILANYATLIESMNSENNLQHIEKYIGKHVYTSEYSFQENLRKNDLQIKKIMENSVDPEKANKFFSNGWSQIISALITLNSHKVSDQFKKIVKYNVDAAIKKGENNSNPFFNVNVREQAKNIMMYPHAGHYLPWQQVNVEEITPFLNNKKYPIQFVHHNNQLKLKIGLEDKKNIFYDLSSSDIANLFKKKGYKGFKLKSHQELPLALIVHSNDLSLLREKYKEQYPYGGENIFISFINSWLSVANDRLQNSCNNYLEFTEICSTYSEDYSPYEEVIVARAKSPEISRMLNILTNRVQNEFNLDLKVKDPFQIVLAIKYRQPSNLGFSSMEEIISYCPKKSYELSKFLEELKK